MSDIPAIKRYARGDRISVQAQRIWMILVAHVEEYKIAKLRAKDVGKRPPYMPTITYGEVAKRMGYQDGRAGFTLGRQLGIIGTLCLANDIPPLNTVVVNKATGEPGESVLYDTDLDKEQKAVLKEDWFALRVPSTGTFRKVWESMGNLEDV